MFYKFCIPLLLIYIIKRNYSCCTNQNCNKVKEKVFFNKYHKYDEVMKFLSYLTENNSHLVDFTYIGLTDNNRKIPLMKLTKNSDVTNKPIIFIDGGIHGREWISVTTAVILLYELLKEHNHYLLENVEWHIMPILNPDGYEFTHTHARFWRKNRSKNNHRCTGVDLNRNFDHKWMYSGSSCNPCEQNYAGPYAFSEKETRYFKKYALKYKDRIKLYVTLHSHGNLLVFPNGYKKIRPNNYNKLNSIAKSVAKKIKDFNGTEYKVGMISEIIYEASGGSDDWMYHVMNISLVFAFELPGKNFEPPESDIKSIGLDIFEGFKIFHYHIDSLQEKRKKTFKMFS